MLAINYGRSLDVARTGDADPITGYARCMCSYIDVECTSRSWHCFGVSAIVGCRSGEIHRWMNISAGVITLTAVLSCCAAGPVYFIPRFERQRSCRGVVMIDDDTYERASIMRHPR